MYNVYVVCVYVDMFILLVLFLWRILTDEIACFDGVHTYLITLFASPYHLPTGPFLPKQFSFYYPVSLKNI